MGRYVLARILESIPVLLAASLAIFAVIHMAPGGPEQVLVDPHGRTEDLARIRENLGLNRPLHVQYLEWLGRLARLDLGHSFVSGQPILDIIAGKLPKTLLLMSVAFAMAVLVSVPIGIYSATHPDSLADYFLNVGMFAGLSVPEFWLGLLLILVFSVGLGWLPSGGSQTLGAPFSLVDRLRHLILPSLVLGIVHAASLMRFVRSSVLEVMTSEFVTTARSKGLRERLVLLRHVLPNALSPVVTVLGMRFPLLIGGSFVIETIFGWGGLGRAAVVAVGERDYPLVIAVGLIVAVATILGNLLSDIVYAVLDPRVRLQA